MTAVPSRGMDIQIETLPDARFGARIIGVEPRSLAADEGSAARLRLGSPASGPGGKGHGASWSKGLMHTGWG